MKPNVPMFEVDPFDLPHGTTHVRIMGVVIELTGVIDSATSVIHPRPGARNLLRLTNLADQWLAENPVEPTPAPKTDDDCGCAERRASRNRKAV